MKHGKPWFHADLNKLPAFQAGMLIEDWVSKNEIQILNVARPRALKDPLIYGLITLIIELVYTLAIAKDKRPEQTSDILNTDRPETTKRLMKLSTDSLLNYP